MSDQAITQAAQAITTNLALLVQVLKTTFVGQASAGSFTMDAAATKTVADANVKSNSIIVLVDKNASAATLQGSAKRLYPSALSAGASFTVATASTASAAGTEIFSYVIITLA